ncbi:hypothetical protein WA158_003416 [Blastocystis sp. Blastoise]
MSEQFFYQNSTTNQITKIHVHPVVPVLILDQYLRRHESQDKIIGTLMGHLSNGVLEVKLCYAVPHEIDGDEIGFGKDYNNRLAQLQKASNPIEEVIGWYCISKDKLQVTKAWNTINTYYRTIVPNPIYLDMDVSLQSNKIDIQVFTTEIISFFNSPRAVKLVKIPMEMDAANNENMILNSILKSDTESFVPKNTELYNDVFKLEGSLKKLNGTLEDLDEYVDKVVSGEISGDQRVGRMLHSALSLLPQIEPEIFSQLIDTKIKDVALVMYLSNLAKTQLDIAEKINSLFNAKDYIVSNNNTNDDMN